MTAILNFADRRDFDYITPKDGFVTYSTENGQDGNPGCLSVVGDNENPTYSLPHYTIHEFDEDINSGSNTIEFYINVTDSETTGGMRIFFYPSGVLPDGVDWTEATLLLSVNRALAAGTFRLQARNPAGSTPYASDPLARNTWHKITLDFTHTGSACTVDISINDSLYLDDHACYNRGIGKMAFEATSASTVTLLDDISITDEPLLRDGYSLLDVTKDTPYGRFQTGDDLTAALQWAATNMKPVAEGGHGRGLTVSPGLWKISSRVEFPYRAGGKFLGEGTTDPTVSGDKQGVSTTFEWIGADDGTAMFKFRGTGYDIGDFTCYADGYSNAVAIAWGKTSGVAGLGTGKSWHRPLRFDGFNKSIELRVIGEDSNENVDNLYFHDLECENCDKLIEMNSTNVMDIHIRKVHISNTSYGIYIPSSGGGGQLTIDQGLVTYGVPHTLLYIEDGADVGNNNGLFKLNNIKVDSQMFSNFTMVQCYNEAQCQFVVENCLISPDDVVGTFAVLSGRNILAILGGSASFNNITGYQGTGGNSAYTPKVIIDHALMEDLPDEIFAGDLQVRVANSTRTFNFPWVDPDPFLAAVNR